MNKINHIHYIDRYRRKILKINVQYLLLKEMISTKKKSDIEIIDNFIKILTKNKTIVPNDFEVDEL